MCSLIANGSTVVFDEDAAVPYTYQGKLWVSYDDERSVYEKVNYFYSPALKKKGGGGTIFIIAPL